MNHADHVDLLRPANLPSGGTWADFGAGSGAFTLALRELIGTAATIYAVDKDRSALKRLEAAYRQHFASTDRLILLSQDFSHSFDLPALDGIIAANSLHYFKDHEKILRHVCGFLKPNGVLLLVEYNVDSGKLWVPHPFSFNTYRSLAVCAGFNEPRLLTTVASSFLREFYSSVT